MEPGLVANFLRLRREKWLPAARAAAAPDATEAER
jgi:hypothetical protein